MAEGFAVVSNRLQGSQRKMLRTLAQVSVRDPRQEGNFSPSQAFPAGEDAPSNIRNGFFAYAQPRFSPHGTRLSLSAAEGDEGVCFSNGTYVCINHGACRHSMN